MNLLKFRKIQPIRNPPDHPNPHELSGWSGPSIVLVHPRRFGGADYNTEMKQNFVAIDGSSFFVENSLDEIAEMFASATESNFNIRHAE